MNKDQRRQAITAVRAMLDGSHAVGDALMSEDPQFIDRHISQAFSCLGEAERLLGILRRSIKSEAPSDE